MLLLLLLLHGSLLLLVDGGRVTLARDGGYRGIVVNIGEDIPEEECAVLVENIKEIFRDGSWALNTATEGRAHFGQVTIVVPATWSEAKCGQTISSPTGNTPYKVAEVEVVAEPGVVGSAPFTVQAGGCGQPGKRLTIPSSFLTQWNASREQWGPPGRLLAREFAKLRYGVFDEFGFSGDREYPNYFTVADRIYPTGTSNAMLTGSWIHRNGSSLCDPTQGECFFRPEGPNRQISCSLGYVPQLDTVERWCSEGDAKEEVGPGKQAVLCQGRTAHQVVLASKDLAGRAKGIGRPAEPDFALVRQPLPKYVLLIETSAMMATVWKHVRKATQNLIRYELPDNTNLAIVTFNNESRVEHQLATLTSSRERTRLADTVPDSPNKLSRSRDRCVVCGVKVAMDQVLRHREAGGHLIIVSRGDANTLSASDMEVLEEYDKYYNIRISSILIPDTEMEVLPFYASIAQASSGLSVSLPDMRGVALLASLVEALVTVVSVDSPAPWSLPVTTHRKVVDWHGEDWATQGNFLIDTTLGRDTIFGVFVEDDENHHIKAVTFRDTEGSVYGPFTKMSSVHDVINLKTINFPIGEKPPFDEAGRQGGKWSYHITWYRQPPREGNIVVVRSKPREISSSSLLKIEVWEGGGGVYSSGLPTLVHTLVTLRGRPVVGALVLLNLVPTNASDNAVSASVTMLDDGRADPDLVAGDGIYSAYIFNHVGPLNIEVEVSDGGGTAYTASGASLLVAQPPKVAVPVCCGSNVPVGQHRMDYTGRFQRKVAGPKVVGRPVEGAVGRVGDLQVEVKGDKVTARWSNTWGKLEGWRFLYAPSPGPLLVPGEQAKGRGEIEVENVEVTEDGGLKYSFSLAGLSGNFYLGLTAQGEGGIRGRVSNLVLVSVKGGEDGSSRPASQPTEGETNWAVLGAVLGVLLVLVLSALFLLLCFCFRRRREKTSSSASMHGFSTTRSSGVNVHIPSPSHSLSTASSSASASPTKPLSAPLVPVMSAPPSSRSMAHLTPTYWSASQLLAEHERGQLPINTDQRWGDDDSRQGGSIQPLYYTTVPEHPQHSHPGQHYTPYYPVPPPPHHHHNHMSTDDEGGTSYHSDMVEEVLEGDLSRGDITLVVNTSTESGSTLPMISSTLGVGLEVW